MLRQIWKVWRKLITLTSVLLKAPWLNPDFHNAVDNIPNNYSELLYCYYGSLLISDIIVEIFVSIITYWSNWRLKEQFVIFCCFCNKIRIQNGGLFWSIAQLREFLFISPRHGQSAPHSYILFSCFLRWSHAKRIGISRFLINFSLGIKPSPTLQPYVRK